MDAIEDQKRDLDSRLAALDELELLVEQVDNANDLQPLKMWPRLIHLLQTDNEPEIRTNVAWVIGTAVQNNPTAQADVINFLFNPTSSKRPMV
jgi:hypothetical protein